MTRFTLSGIAAAILLALTAAQSQAAIVFGPNGSGGLNAYERIDVTANYAGAVAGSAIAFPGAGPFPASAVVGHLATFSTSAEYEFLTTLRAGAPTDVYIGLTDDPAFAAAAFENGNNSGGALAANGAVALAGQRGAGWALVGGGLNTFHQRTPGVSIWGGGEPNDAGGEDAATIRGDGLLNDLPISASQAYIREWDLNVALPAGGWNSQTFRRNPLANINNLAEADNAINAGTLLGSGTVNSVNYFEPGGGGGTGNFGGDVEPFGLTGGADEDFTVKSTGFLQIGVAGNYQFRNNTDDGSRLRIDLNKDGVFGPGETVILDDVLSAPHNADSAAIALLPGQYMIEHVWFERGGGAEGDLGVAFNGGAFQLFGNPRTDGLGAFLSSGAFVTQNAIIPEPASLSMLALGGLALLRRRRAA